MPTTKTEVSSTRPARAAALYEKGKQVIEPTTATYNLSRFDCDDAPTEDFKLSADQYEALKHHLAALQAPPLTRDQKYKAQMALYRDKAKVINALLGGIDGHAFEALETLRLIMSRVYCDSNGPVDKFIMSLVHQYRWAEDDGRGLTVGEIERLLEELRKDMAEDVAAAYFIADRYPRPEASADSAAAAHD